MIGAHIHRKLFLAIFAMGTTLPIASAQEPLRALALNQSFESTIKPKEIHSYSLNAERGQFVQVAVDQKGMDVALRMFSPNGKILAESNLGNWGQGPEIVSLIADEPISVRVEVLGLRPHEVNGTYSIKLREARAKQFGDEQLIAAENLWQGRSVASTAAVFFFVPARRLPTNDYVIELAGITSDGKRESVASYFLTVLKN